MFVYSNENPRFHSNRLDLTADEYEKSDRIEDFSKCKTLDDIIAIFEDLVDKELHLVGSRGYVYHSGSLLSMMKHLKEEKRDIDDAYYWSLYPRSGMLRHSIMSLV